ncbi:MAG: glutathione S-transferase family protein, partial [Bradyrhizobium sp.]|nr:glutathione S-transferase family protein [Bradyrhizobium sp.]
LAINPDGVVPTLVCDGEVVRESAIINEYIDSAFSGLSLVPKNPLRAARMREFIRACDEALKPIALLTYVKYILPKLRNRWRDDELRKQASQRPTKFLRDLHSRGIRGEIGEQELRQASEDIQVLLDILDRKLESGSWIVGEFSLADICIAPYMFRLSALGQNSFWSVERRPRINEWYQRLSSRPAFLSAVSWPDENGGGYQEVGLKSSAP